MVNQLLLEFRMLISSFEKLLHQISLVFWVHVFWAQFREYEFEGNSVEQLLVS